MTPASSGLSTAPAAVHQQGLENPEDEAEDNEDDGQEYEPICAERCKHRGDGSREIADQRNNGFHCGHAHSLLSEILLNSIS